MSFVIGLILPLLIILGVYFLFKKPNLRKSTVIFYLIGKTLLYIVILYVFRNFIVENFGMFLAGFGVGFFLMILFLIVFVMTKNKARVQND